MQRYWAADVEAETLEVLRHWESPFDRCAATLLERLGGHILLQNN
jgi:hypothetical protein